MIFKRTMNKHPRPVRPAALWFVAAATLVVSGCTPAANSQVDGLEPTAATSPIAEAPRVDLDQTYISPDGLAVKISDAVEVEMGLFPTSEDPAAKEGDPYVITTITFTNNAAAAQQLVVLADMRYGTDARHASRVAVEDEKDQMVLQPDEEVDYDIGTIIPAGSRTDVELEVTLSIDPIRRVVFAGSLADLITKYSQSQPVAARRLLGGLRAAR